MKKILLTISALFLFLFIFVNPSMAITQTAGDLQVTHDEPLFPDSQVWYPGLVKTNSIVVKNTGGGVKGLGVNATNYSQTGGLADVLFFKIYDGGQNVYGGDNDRTMSEFWTSGGFEIANMGPGETKTIVFTVYMPESLGNEYQGTKANFDLIIGFLNQSSVIFTASGDGGGGGGTTTTSTGAVLGATTNPLTNFFSFFTGEEPEDVLGEATDESDLKEETINVGQVKGETTCTQCKYIIPLLFEILALALYYWLIIKKDSQSNLYLTLFIPIITYLIYYLINQNCVSSFWVCKYFAMINAVIYGVSILLIKKTLIQKKV